MTETRNSVLIVEDVDDIRSGLAAFIDSSDGFRCVGAFASAESALQSLDGMLQVAPDSLPNVILMDINLPGMSGIDCIRIVKAKAPKIQIMMLTVFEDDDMIFRSLAAGASGYLIKTTPPEKILEAIRELASGGSPMSSQIARRVVSVFQGTSGGSDIDTLSQREQEVLSYLAKGFRYKEIADKLFISIETVRTHIRNIYEKLHVRSRTEAVLKYLKQTPSR